MANKGPMVSIGNNIARNVNRRHAPNVPSLSNASGGCRTR